MPVTTGPDGVVRWGVQERVQVREVRMMQQAFKGKRDESGNVVWTPVDPGSLGLPPGVQPPTWDFSGMGGSGSGGGGGSGSVREIGKKESGSSSRR